jgi:hypothetical protein
MFETGPDTKGYRFNERAKDKAQNRRKRVGRRMMMFESMIEKDGTGEEERMQKKSLRWVLRRVQEE